MNTLTQRLESARPVIEKIPPLSGSVGLSYEVLHEGKIVHTESFGFRDHDKTFPVDEETIFPLCSLTKAMLASEVCMPVSTTVSYHGKPRSGILSPAFQTQAEELHQSAPILSSLSMRTGMQQYGTSRTTSSSHPVTVQRSLTVPSRSSLFNTASSTPTRSRANSHLQHHRRQLGLLPLEQHLQAPGPRTNPALWTRAT